MKQHHRSLLTVLPAGNEAAHLFSKLKKKTPKSALLMLILAPQRKATVSMWTEAVQSVSLINLSAKNVIT